MFGLVYAMSFILINEYCYFSEAVELRTVWKLDLLWSHTVFIPSQLSV